MLLGELCVCIFFDSPSPAAFQTARRGRESHTAAQPRQRRAWEPRVMCVFRTLGLLLLALLQSNLPLLRTLTTHMKQRSSKSKRGSMARKSFHFGSNAQRLSYGAHASSGGGGRGLVTTRDTIIEEEQYTQDELKRCVDYWNVFVEEPDIC